MSESAEQKEVVAWFRAKYPEHAMSLRVSQSGGHRGKGKSAAIRIAKAKGQGEVKGEADIGILLPKGGYGCLLVEHKGEGMAHTLNESQALYLDYHNRIGNCAVSTRGVDALKAAILLYMSL
jgi:hypothetical protein